MDRPRIWRWLIQGSIENSVLAGGQVHRIWWLIRKGSWTLRCKCHSLPSRVSVWLNASIFLGEGGCRWPADHRTESGVCCSPRRGYPQGSWVSSSPKQTRAGIFIDVVKSRTVLVGTVASLCVQSCSDGEENEIKHVLRFCRASS